MKSPFTPEVADDVEKASGPSIVARVPGNPKSSSIDAAGQRSEVSIRYIKEDYPLKALTKLPGSCHSNSINARLNSFAIRHK